MRKSLKRLLHFIGAIAVVFMMLSLSVLADYVGADGNIDWALNTATGELTITGEGPMNDYTLEHTAPWYQYRSSVKSVNIADGVTSVGAYAFYSHTALTSATITADVDTVSYSAFAGCTSLASVTLGNESAVVEGSAFNGCNALMVTSGDATYIKIGNNANFVLYSVSKSASSFTVPSTVAVIADGAFNGCTLLTTISIPDSVITVGDRAFNGCTALEEVTLGSGVKHIGNLAFAGCTALNTLTFNSVPEFVGSAIISSSASVSGTVDSGVMYFGPASNPYAVLYKALSNDITSYTLNENTKTVAASAFANCAKLETVTFNNGLVNICDSAFNGCVALRAVALPSTVVSIGDFAFKNATSLTSVSLSSVLEVIGSDAFRGATSLTSINIPKCTKLVGYNAFRGASALKKVYYNGKSFGYKAFADCTSLEEVYLSDEFVTLGDYAFSGCSALEKIALPATMKQIGFGAFYACSSIKAMSLPFAGDAANGSYRFVGYIFGAMSAESSQAPSSLKTLLIGNALPQNALLGCNSVTTLILDNNVSSVAAPGYTPSTVYFLGSSDEWSDVSGSSALSSAAPLTSDYTVDTDLEAVVPAQILSYSDVAVTLSNSTNVTDLIRFSANPVVRGLHVRLGSVEKTLFNDNASGVEINGYSILLEGNIGVKFYVTVDSKIQPDVDEVVTEVNYLGKTTPVTLKKCANKEDSYYAVFYVAAKEMRNDITFLATSVGTTKSVTVSVKQYVDYINDNEELFEENVIHLANEMYNYGEYARKYFGAETIEPKKDLSEVEVNIPDKFNPTKSGAVEGLSFFGTNLLLESSTTVRYSFKLQEGYDISDYTFTYAKKNYTPVLKDGLYVVDVKNIVATRLGSLDKFTVEYNSDKLEIVYSPISYAKQALTEKFNAEENLKNLAKALYNYYVAAYDYYYDNLEEKYTVTPSENETDIILW